MAETNANESADQRREKLKALRERRGPGNRKPATANPGAGAGAGGGEGGDRRAKLKQIMQQRAGGGAKGGGKLGAKMGGKAGGKMGAKMGGKMGGKMGAKAGAKAGGAGGDKRAKLMKAMKNPQQREKLMERFPQLREKMGGSAGAKAGAKGAKGAKAARRGGASGDPALGRQVKALEGRVAELERELKKVRDDAPAKPAGAK